VPPFLSRSMRTRSSNSRGKLERKIACFAPPNSTTVASRKRALPARSAVICTGTRTGVARGKNRANRSAQPCSFASSVNSLDGLTLPLTPLQYSGTKVVLNLPIGIRTSANGHNVPAIEMHAARQRIGKGRGPDIEERERLKIFLQVVSGSLVSR
jgi:hypothetical protein